MTKLNIEVPRYWNTKEPERDKRIAGLISKGTGNPEEVSAVWYRYLHDRVQFPFYGYIMTPDSTPTVTKSSRICFVKLAPLDRCQGGHIVLIGGSMLDDNRWHYYFLCDLQKMETDISGGDALLDYLYWIKVVIALGHSTEIIGKFDGHFHAIQQKFGDISRYDRYLLKLCQDIP